MIQLSAISGIVLSAGAYSRMKEGSKLLLPCGEKCVIERGSEEGLQSGVGVSDCGQRASAGASGGQIRGASNENSTQ